MTWLRAFGGAAQVVLHRLPHYPRWQMTRASIATSTWLLKMVHLAGRLQDSSRQDWLSLL
jgi:hypothetical protein